VWTQADVLQSEHWPEATVIVANLFIHHFSAEQIGWLGAQVRQRAQCFLAAEPLRARLPMVNGALIGALCDFNRVTWNDMMISIRAGFRDDELPRLMGWTSGWRVSHTLLGAYRLHVE
jgi:hypothetical protein